MEKTLYNSKFEHDACGIGAIIDLNGEPSFSIVDDALTIVEKLEHRAGKDATGEIGDGVGIMLQVPHEFFSKVGKEMGITLGNRRDYGVGMFFFPQDVLSRLQSQKMFEIICAIICGVLSLISLIISIMSFMERGFLFNNAYIWASKQERESMDKKPYYRQSAIVFALFAAVFLFMALDCYFLTDWLWILSGTFSVAAIIYAVVSSRNETDKE